MKKNYLVLALIALFFLTTRIYNISSVPASLYWDEASIGYNAYSIATDGRDEWGKFLPLHFRAFGEFKLPVYIYSVAVLTKIFGLNELVVRIPAVFSSLITTILIYFIAKKISGNSLVGLFSAFFLSISPWFFIFSRTGYEASMGVMFFCLGVCLYLYNLTKPSIKFLALIFFIISAYTYNSFRVLLPLVFVYYLLDFLRSRRFDKKSISIFLLEFLFFILGLIPILRLLFFNSGNDRLSTIGIFNQSDNIFEMAAIFLKNYLSYFDPNFLFIKGDINLRSQLYGFGQLYLTDLVLIILGIFVSIRKKGNYLIPIMVILASIIPGAITKESPHALRTITVAPFIAIIIGLGANYIVTFFKNKWLSYRYIIVILIGFSILYFANYFLTFINQYRVYSAVSWLYPYKELFLEYKDKFKNYNKVIISDDLGQPYIFGLYYLKYSPHNFREQVQYNNPDKWGMSLVSSFDNFVFSSNLNIVNTDKNLLIFSRVENIPELTKIGKIKNLDGSVAFNIYEYKK